VGHGYYQPWRSDSGRVEVLTSGWLLVGILEIDVFFWNLFVYDYCHTICLFGLNCQPCLGVSGGQRLTRRRRAPLEIPKSPRANRAPTQWSRFVCARRLEGPWPFGWAPLPTGAALNGRVSRRRPVGCAPLHDGAGSFVRVEGRWPFGYAHLPDGAGSFFRFLGPLGVTPCPMGRVRSCKWKMPSFAIFFPFANFPPYSRVDGKNIPPPGGFPIYYVPSSRTVCKRTPLSTWYKFFEGCPLTHGSWWGNIVNRKPLRGGGFLSIRVSRGWFDSWHCDIPKKKRRSRKVCACSYG